VVFKKSTSLLGDYYLEIDPGTEVAVGPDGTEQVFEQLGDGDQVPRVVESTSVDQLLRRIDETLPDVDAVLASIKDLSEDLRRIVNGPIASIANNVDDLVEKESDRIDEIIAKAGRIVDRIDSISKDIKGITGDADGRVDKILDNLDAASAEAKQLMVSARAEIEATGGKMREKLDKVDAIIEHTESISKKIDEDRGTLGKLVNDPAIADNVEAITDDARGFLGTLFGLQTYVGLRSEFNVRAQTARHYVSIELQTRPDKFYLFEIERGPRGAYPETTLEYDPNGMNPNEWVRKVVIRDKTRFTFQFAKRFQWLTLRFGLKESSGGIGVDAEQRWYNKNLRGSIDVFDVNWDQLPRVRVTAAMEVFRYIYVLGGIEDALNPPDSLVINTGMDDVPIQFEEFEFGRDFFVGAMLRFNDKDLAALLAVGGSAVTAAAE
jgi:phospholipid/cholesterol/gamma-HCH transport system substrate-binding protein